MMRITLIAVGKLKERFWREACDEYLKRLGGYAKVSVREIPDSAPAREAEAILSEAAKHPDARLVLLDRTGSELSSEGFAANLDNLATNGCSHVAFVIGGSDGVTEEVRERADARMSFGAITLPHNLARVVLLEQIYRAFKICRKEPYHK